MTLLYRSMYPSHPFHRYSLAFPPLLVGLLAGGLTFALYPAAVVRQYLFRIGPYGFLGLACLPAAVLFARWLLRWKVEQVKSLQTLDIVCWAYSTALAGAMIAVSLTWTGSEAFPFWYALNYPVGLAVVVFIATDPRYSECRD